MPRDRKRLLGYVETIQLILGVTDNINYNIDAFCVEHILRSSLNFSDIFDALLPSETAKENGRK